MGRLKKTAACMLAGALSAASVMSVVASPADTYNQITEDGGIGNSEVTLTVKDQEKKVIFSAYVPAQLPIGVDSNGNITIPTTAKIVNPVDSRAIEVSSVAISMADGWALTRIGSMDGVPDNSKQFAISIAGHDLYDEDKGVPWRIEKGSEMPLDLKAELPRMTKAQSNTRIATIGFTLNWSSDPV